MSSQIIIRKNLIIFCRPDDWYEIYQKILTDFGDGMAVRTKLRRELGFTYRVHTEWLGQDVRQIHLDFYNESAQSWFQLRYLNF
jgi:hypothetical protein